MFEVRHIAAALLLTILTACKPAHQSSVVNLPTSKLPDFETDSKITYENDSLNFYLHNPLKCPLRYFIRSSDSLYNNKLKNIYPLLLQPESDTVFKFPATKDQAYSLKAHSVYGDTSREVEVNKLNLPFPPGKEYTIIQGYNGNYSHNSGPAKYALDFGLKKGDTICAADNGYVVGVVKDYSNGGTDKAWMGYANNIYLYHPHSGLYTQYTHLNNNGCFVKVGDKVTAGQPIGLAGMTGWTNIQHLHFNVLRPAETNLEGVPAEFEGGYKGEDLQKGDIVKHLPQQHP